MPEVIMPRLSDTMEEGELTRWMKKVGDPIKKGDVLAEIETDKATMDLEAFEDGILEQLLVPDGTLVAIGQPVAVIGDGTNIAAAGAPAAPPAAAAPEPPAEPSAAPAQAEAPAPAATAPAASVPAASVPAASVPAPAATPTRQRTSPLARKIAREHEIDLNLVVGTGPQGRITRTDVETAIAAAEAAPAAPEVAPPSAAAAPAPAGAGTQSIPISKIRKVTARRLTESQAVPHFFLTSVVDVERLVAFRAEVNSSLAELGVKVSLNDLFVRACAVVLRQHPAVNASWGGDSILRHDRINVGVAVATDDGLLVPVVTDADRKALGTIAAETVELARLARTGGLSLAQMTGGTFTISNLGMFGIDQFTAVLNPPEAAILAVGAATDVPVLRDGVLVAVPQVKITLTVDHRVLDGAVAAAFLRDLTRLLEQPLRIVV